MQPTVGLLKKMFLDCAERTKNRLTTLDMRRLSLTVERGNRKAIDERLVWSIAHRVVCWHFVQ